MAPQHKRGVSPGQRHRTPRSVKRKAPPQGRGSIRRVCSGLAVLLAATLLTALLATLLLLTGLLLSGFLLVATLLLATLLLLAWLLVLILILTHPGFLQHCLPWLEDWLRDSPAIKITSRELFRSVARGTMGAVASSIPNTMQKARRHGTLSVALALGNSASHSPPDLGLRRAALTRATERLRQKTYDP
jgi:hypothetical protein